MGPVPSHASFLLSGVEQSLRGGHALGVASPCETDDLTADETDRPTDGSNSDDEVVDGTQTVDSAGGHCGESVNMCVEGDNDGDFSHVKPVIDRLPDTLTNIIFKKLQAIYLMLYKRQIENSKNHRISTNVSVSLYI